MLMEILLRAIARSTRGTILIPPVSPLRATLDAQGRSKRQCRTQTRNVLIASKAGASAKFIASTWLETGAGAHPMVADREFLPVALVTTGQTDRTTTRALAPVNRTCVQTETETEEEEVIL